jgi:hypothetical protein
MFRDNTLEKHIKYIHNCPPSLLFLPSLLVVLGPHPQPQACWASVVHLSYISKSMHKFSFLKHFLIWVHMSVWVSTKLMSVSAGTRMPQHPCEGERTTLGVSQCLLPCFILIFILIYCMYMWVYLGQGSKDDFWDSILSYHVGSQGSSSDRQSWETEPSPTKPSC